MQFLKDGVQTVEFKQTYWTCMSEILPRDGQRTGNTESDQPLMSSFIWEHSLLGQIGKSFVVSLRLSPDPDIK